MNRRKLLPITTSMVVMAMMTMLVFMTSCQSELTKGKLYLRDGKDDEAQRYLEQAQAKRPTDPEVPFLIGTLHARRGEYAQMNEAFERCLALGDDHFLGVDRVRTDHFTTEYNRGVTILNGQPPGYAAAARAFTAATVINPGQAAGWRNLGYAYFKLDSLRAATNAYEGAARADASDPVSWFDLGTAQLANQRYGDAIASFEQLMNLDPQHWDGLRSLAQAYEGSGDTDAAIGVYERLLAVRPADEAAYYNLGNLHWQQQAYDQASAAYEAALALDPYDDDALHNLALCYIVVEDTEKALPLLLQLVERMPENAILWRELGRLHYLRGELAESERAFAREEALSPE